MPRGPAGPVPGPPAKTAPHGPATGNREVSHPISTGTRAGPRPSPRGKIVNRPSELNACLGPIMPVPRTRSSSLEHSRLKTTRPSRHMISRPSRLMTTRPPRLMTARPSRLRLGPAMPMTRSSSLEHVPGHPKIAYSSCPSTGPSKTLCVHPLLARIEPSFGFTSRTQRPLRQFLNPSLPLVASPIPHP